MSIEDGNNKKFERWDSKLKPNQIFNIYTKIENGDTAKISGILLIILGVAALACVPVLIKLDLNYDTEFTKYFSFLVIGGGGGIGGILGGIYHLYLNHKYQLIMQPIYENGLLTDGVIRTLDKKSRFRGLFNKRGWKYKIAYKYTDNYGITYYEQIKMTSVEEKDLAESKTISVIFYGGNSAMIELYNLDDTKM